MEINEQIKKETDQIYEKVYFMDYFYGNSIDTSQFRTKMLNGIENLEIIEFAL